MATKKEIDDFRRLIQYGVVYDDGVGRCMANGKQIGFINNKTGRYIEQSCWRPVGTARDWNRTYWLLDRFIYWFNWGKIPERINHINGDKSDCHIDNLQELTKTDLGFVVAQKPSILEVELHKKELLNLQQTPLTGYEWFLPWKQKIIEKGEWKPKHIYEWERWDKEKKRLVRSKTSHSHKKSIFPKLILK